MEKACLIRLNLWQALVFLVVMSLALTVLMFLMQPLPSSYTIDCIIENRGFTVFLNWLPLFLIMLFLYFAGTGAASASTIVGAVGIAMAFANRTKVVLRNDPLVPWDLLLGSEVAGIAGSFGTGAILRVVGFAVFYILLAVVAAIVICSVNFDWRIRVGGVIGCIILAVVLNYPLYSSAVLDDRLRVEGNAFNQVNQFNSRGLVYSFIFAFNTNRVLRPDNYNPDAVFERIAQADTGGLARLEGASLPHIIMIQGEAFSEISLSPHFNFDGFADPLENWQEIKTEGIHGEIVVPVLGGGTAQTEFDVLTGLNARQFAGVPFAFRMINYDFESMASILNSLGYRSEFMHSGFGWFYNRQNVYRHLGFQRLVFIDEFVDVKWKSGYISEYATINRVMEMFAEHRETYPNVPYFHFCVTIQNHGPYVDKYLFGDYVTAPTFTTDLPLSEIDINALSNYFHGVQDADIELRRLVEYLRVLPEPVVLVYFSDHLPALHMRIYDTLFPEVYEHGSFEDLTQLYRVPFLIWFNDAARDLYNITHPTELIDTEETLLFSSAFLGAFVMETLGFTNISPFWDFNAELRRVFPVMTETRSFAPCGTPSIGKSDEQRAPLFLYRDWSYFRLFHER